MTRMGLYAGFTFLASFSYHLVSFFQGYVQNVFYWYSKQFEKIIFQLPHSTWFY